MNLFKNLGLKKTIMFAVFMTCFICSAIAIAGFKYFNEQELYRGIINKSRAIHLRLDAATDFVATQQGLIPVIDRMKQKYKSSEDMTKEDKEVVLKQVPIVSAMKIGAKDSEKDAYKFIVFSDAPRNEGNQADAKQLEIFKKFESDANLTEHVVNKDGFISVYRPVRLKKEQGCFTCHGDPKTSPWGNGRDILGYKMENWNDGKLHGVFEVRTDINKVIALEESGHMITPAGILISAILGGSVIAIIMATLLISAPLKNLDNIVKTLSQSAEQVSSASTQIASSAEELSQASTEQAASLQETSSSIEEINSMVANNTDNAKKSLNITEQNLSIANRGKGVVNEMVHAINDIDQSNQGIKSQIDSTFKEIENVVNIINEINTKTKVINDIVFQTKLLSFNASVEAARAGEQGKGFAVVAEEVGNLASMSGSAAVEISTLLENSKSTVENLVRNSKDKMQVFIDAGTEKVNKGTKVAHECEDVLEEIVQTTSSVTGLMNEISNASIEQSKGIGEITKAVGQLELATHQNSSTASESANASNSLANQANVLANITADLVELTEGKKKKT